MNSAFLTDRCLTQRSNYALSAKSFSQADMPLGRALRLYDAFSGLVQRKWTCSVARSLAGRGGLPRFGLSMADIMSHNKVIDNLPRQVFNVYTLNKEVVMKRVIDQMGWPVVAVGAIWATESLLNIFEIVRGWL